VINQQKPQAADRSKEGRDALSVLWGEKEGVLTTAISGELKGGGGKKPNLTRGKIFFPIRLGKRVATCSCWREGTELKARKQKGKMGMKDAQF